MKKIYDMHFHKDRYEAKMYVYAEAPFVVAQGMAMAATNHSTWEGFMEEYFAKPLGLAHGEKDTSGKLSPAGTLLDDGTTERWQLFGHSHKIRSSPKNNKLKWLQF